MSKPSNSVFPIVKQRIKDIIDSERWLQKTSDSSEIPYSSYDLAVEALNTVYGYLRSKVFLLSHVSIDTFGVFNAGVGSESISFTEAEHLRRMIEREAESSLDRTPEHNVLNDALLKDILGGLVACVYDPRSGYEGESEVITKIILEGFVFSLSDFLAHKQRIQLDGIGRLFLDSERKICYEPTPDLLEVMKLGKSR